MSTRVIAQQEYTVKRHGGSGTGHWGHSSFQIEGESSSSSGIGPERMLGRTLGPGTRIRVRVEVLEEIELTDEHTTYNHSQSPSGMCLDCVRMYPEKFAILACGHGRPVHVWERDGRPDSMSCWDGWCPSRCGEQRVVRVNGWIIETLTPPA